MRTRRRRSIPEDIEVLPPWKPFGDPARVSLNAMYQPYGATDEDMARTFFDRLAADFLAEKRDGPFLLIVSFYEPHSPVRLPIEYLRRHDPASGAGLHPRQTPPHGRLQHGASPAGQIPKTDHPMRILDQGVQPHDVSPEGR